MGTCDGCNKPRRDLQPVAFEPDGEPAVFYCFLCRKEAEREARRLAFEAGEEL